MVIFQLKMVVAMPIFKKDSLFDKANDRPISLLSSLSTVYEKIIHQQLNSRLEKKLFPLLCGSVQDMVRIMRF